MVVNAIKPRAKTAKPERNMRKTEIKILLRIIDNIRELAEQLSDG